MKFKIKEARERTGLSQKELALKLNIKPSTFNGYEKGTHDPKSEILSQIAEACETSVDYLLGRKSDPTPDNKKATPEEIRDSLDKLLKEMGINNKTMITREKADLIGRMIIAILESDKK